MNNVLIVVPLHQSSKDLLNNETFNKFKDNLKIIYVNDEESKNILVKADINTFPRLMVYSNNDYISIVGITKIISFLISIYGNNNQQKNPQSMPEIVKNIEHSENIIYSTNKLVIIYKQQIEDVDPKHYDIIISTPQMFLTGENVIQIEQLNKKVFDAILQRSKDYTRILVFDENIGKSIASYYMFHIERFPVEEIEKFTNTKIREEQMFLM